MSWFLGGVKAFCGNRREISVSSQQCERLHGRGTFTAIRMSAALVWRPLSDHRARWGESADISLSRGHNRCPHIFHHFSWITRRGRDLAIVRQV
ncbi:hypothetical protein HIV01_004830 [Lysobacter arenosi]|uniref:Uncharacterized protein n=1 Tax=Lysobacter arenosi TaxID=2795387 RepID=A0ABX7RDS3_9GAMM|nr:hypothetical protein [Lysobacter arenosi]QSX75850.1 hypothetical protein HIV01_004830 [Lysobacter arenosi]